jgi:hypothetical protein
VTLGRYSGTAEESLFQAVINAPYENCLTSDFQLGLKSIHGWSQLKKLLVMVSLAVLLGVGLSPAAATAGTSLGGRVSKDLRISLADSPVTLTSTLQILGNATVTVDSGVVLRVSHSEWAFQAEGSLVFESGDRLTVFHGNGSKFLDVPLGSDNTVSLSKTRFKDPGEFQLTGVGAFSLLASQVSGYHSIDTGYSGTTKIQDSAFYFNPTTSQDHAVNDSCKLYGIAIHTNGLVNISRNSFQGGIVFKGRCDPWLFVAQPYSSLPLVIENNTFATWPASIGHFSSDAKLVSNFIVKPKNVSIEDLVNDNFDDLSLPGRATFTSNLDAPSPNSSGLWTDVTSTGSGSSKSFEVSQKTLATFSGSATGLTSQQKSQVKAAVEANPNAEKFICTGIRYYSQPMSVNIMVRKRAKAACDYAKELNPSLSTWYQNKATQARSYSGKVLLTVKTPAR